MNLQFNLIYFYFIFKITAEIGVKSSDNEGPKIEEKPEWVPDSSCSKCCLCHAEFTFANRRVSLFFSFLLNNI